MTASKNASIGYRDRSLLAGIPDMNMRQIMTSIILK